ncbi:MAG: hypothetical protein IKW78_06520 [Prevotella sp.]|nr:hypothetical protein [Prevotella sp.]
MKKIEYMKPAMRVRQLYTEGSVMDTIVVGSPNGGGGDEEMDDSEAFAKDFDDDFAYPAGGSVWED